jgi:hypothetical protein
VVDVVDVSSVEGVLGHGPEALATARSCVGRARLGGHSVRPVLAMHRLPCGSVTTVPHERFSEVTLR